MKDKRGEKACRSGPPLFCLELLLPSKNVQLARRFPLDRFNRSSCDRRMKLEPAILDVLFPKVRAEILRSLFGGSNRQRYVRELARETGLALSTIQQELANLSSIGIVTSYSNGFHRFYLANGGHPLIRELCRIVELSDRLPRRQRSVLSKQQRRPGRKDRRRPRKTKPLRPDRSGVNWGMFSARKS